jgi:hypothetical protein
MGKIKASQILVKNAKLGDVRLVRSVAEDLIISVRKKQSDLQKLKEVDQEKLKLVVQL